ncbi:hypothetical protein CAEBREN_12342 [Caenorhabditis brenneri]|uniref:Ubiquitin-like protease family profile domain-containing protein n=1 Tax=Caenorhabditis brenneri TaxID=135651 RepID=G0MYR9_CAEBE|nr:hypothetical protein CAEBREN_12342 [Caenorhabditis brenneri]
MEQYQYNEFSLKIVNEHDEVSNTDGYENHIFDRMTTGGEIEEEVKFGEQLQDDLINSFCDKLQAVCPRRIEAFLAIQFLMITDAADVRRHVTGKHSAIQVLYDRTRSHYVMVHYNSRYQHVEVYDSLQPFNEKGEPMLLRELNTHISHLFGHLHTKYIPVLVDREFEAQSDSFSCGYRVVAALVDLARGRNPARYTYSRSAILEFMRRILNDPYPPWQMFESAVFGQEKYYSGNHRVKVLIENTTFVPTSSSSSCSSKSSTDSNTSRHSRHFRTSPSSKKPVNRKSAGRITQVNSSVSTESQEENPFMEKIYSMLPKQALPSLESMKNWHQNFFSQLFRSKDDDDVMEKENEKLSVFGMKY